MTKRLTAPIIRFIALLAIAFIVSGAFLLTSALPAEAQVTERPASALQAVEAQVVKTAETSSVDKRVYGEGDSFYQGVGVTWVYDIDDLGDFSYGDDWRIDITSVSGTGSVRYEPIASDPGRFSVTAERAGSVTLTCLETWMEHSWEWSEESEDSVYVEAQQSRTHSFTIVVVELENTSGTLVGYLGANERSKTFTFKLSDLPADATVEWVSDSNKNGDSMLQDVEAGKVTLYVYGVGTHTIKLKAYGKTVTCKAVLRTLALKKTAAVKDTGSVVAYPGQKSVVGVTLTGVKNPKVAWSSTNPRIATVNKKGVVKAKAKGRCYLKAKVGTASVKVLVEVTSEQAYKAVRNGFADMRTKLTYSQPGRMTAMSRDCSSFVSRCYWDSSLGRRIALIGGSGAASWAYNAAAQAQWLESQGKRVSWNACSVKKLRPGDTIYFETDYAGKDATQWHYIDHAALYVGNGLYLNTGGYGGKGTVGLARYGYGNVKFIGRPCA